MVHRPVDDQWVEEAIRSLPDNQGLCPGSSEQNGAFKALPTWTAAVAAVIRVVMAVSSMNIKRCGALRTNGIRQRSQSWREALTPFTCRVSKQ